MKKDWLVYRVTDYGSVIGFDTVWYAIVLQCNYKERLKLKGRRDIIKSNLSNSEAENFVNILNKLKK